MGVTHMKKFLQKRLNNEKGLTLVELLAVIVILGIIAAIAVPSIGGIIQGSREKAVIADAQNALSAASLYFVDNNTADDQGVNLATLVSTDFIEDTGNLNNDIIITKKAKSANVISGTGKAGSKRKVTFNGATKQDLSSKATGKVSISDN